MSALPADLQPLFDTLSQAAVDASASDASKAVSAAALASAQSTDALNAADQLAKHQAVTVAVGAFVAAVQADFPS